ncbi:MAG: hypothetical protein ABI348_09900 [Nitrososphaera sp.]
MAAQGKEKQQAPQPDAEQALPAVSSFTDPRLPHNMENVVSTLLQVMIAKGMISLADARQIMKSGESYLH